MDRDYRFQCLKETGAQTLTWSLDVPGRPRSEAGPLGPVAIQWDAASRNTRITWPDGYCARNVYDVSGSMTQVREDGATSGAGLLATYGYDHLGRRISQGRGNGAAMVLARRLPLRHVANRQSLA